MLGAGLIGRPVARIARLYDQADVEGAEDDELETNGECDDGLLDGEPERGRRRVRHPRQKDDGMDRIMRALEKGADPNTLMNMEMFRMMKEMRDEDRRRRTRTEECDSDSGEELRARTALGKAVAGMNRHKRRVSERPKAIIKEFKANVMEELGITSPKEPWRYVDTHRRITWGQYRTPQRAYILRPRRWRFSSPKPSTSAQPIWAIGRLPGRTSVLWTPWRARSGLARLANSK